MDTGRWLDELERRVTILEGKPDPGLVCPGKPDLCCWRGTTYYRDETRCEVPGTCEVCGGTGRVYPPV